MSANEPIRSASDLEALGEQGQTSLYPDQPKVLVGTASCGRAAGAEEVFETFEEALTNESGISLGSTGCLGFCAREPLVEVRYPEGRGVIYEDVSPEDAARIGDALLAAQEPTDVSVLGVREYESAGEDQSGQWMENDPVPDVDFFAGQQRIVLRNSGLIDPTSAAEYVARGGYHQLWTALTDSSPEAIIEEVKDSGLRGRGGAGFPTGLKWEFTRNATGPKTYVICNAKGGDPGSDMDRAILESDPFAVLESMTIAAYAVGADSGIIYVHADYPLAVDRLETAIEKGREYGLLGEDILGRGFDFDVRVKRGSSAFIAGEETALVNSIGSERAEPDPKPPWPSQKGLNNHPTLINNVETLVNVQPILENGAKWFDAIGTEESPGTKVFSLTGSTDDTGLIEVPLGTPLEDIIFGMGSADPDSVKAVQTGGPSGGCLPAETFETTADYESLESMTSMMGSGGLIVLDEGTCMVDLARHFLTFTRDESCGKCNPGRLGTKRMVEILETLTEGRASRADFDRLTELSEYLADSSLCGLGIAAPMPVESTMRYFRDEYEAHLDGECPAGECAIDADPNLAPKAGGGDR